MSTSANQDDKGKSIVIDSSSSDSESESTRDDLIRNKGKEIVLDSEPLDSESTVMRQKRKRIVKDSSSCESDDSGSTDNKRGSRIVDEDVDDDSHQVPSAQRQICGCFSRRPCPNCYPDLPMGNSGPSQFSHQQLNVTAPRPPSVALHNFQSNERTNFPSNVPELRSVLNTPRINFGVQSQSQQYLQTIFMAQSAIVSWGIFDVPAPRLAFILGAGFTIGLRMNHAAIIPPPQSPLIYSGNIQFSPNYYEQPPLTYSGNIYLSLEYYELAQLHTVNHPVALSSHQRAPHNFQGVFRPVAAQPNPSSLQPPPHLWNLRAIQMLRNYFNPDIDNMSYEDLIRLGEVIGDVPTELSEERIYELMWRSSYSVSSRGESFEMGEFCAVCLESFSDGEDVAILYCEHSFHTICIVPWLRTRNSCPICRSQALIVLDE